MDDLNERFAARDRVRRAMAAKLTAAERMELMAELQRRAAYLMPPTSEGFARFWRRNVRKRAIRDEGPHAAG